RSQGVATFVGAIMVSELCAPGIGGILADRLGERSVFAIGAGIMLLSALVGSSVLTRRVVPDRRRAPRSQDLTLHAIRNPRFITLLLTAAIPAKFALTAFMFYIVPVGLASLDIPKAEIGRVAMLYAIPSVLAASLFARLADRMGCAGLMVGVGSMISGAGFLPLLFWPSETAIVIGVLALGLGHAMSISPQLALVTEICSEEISRSGGGGVLGIYRLVERIGAALGPVVAGALVAQLGPLEAAGMLGMISFVSGVTFSVAFLVVGVHPEKNLFSEDLTQKENPA
ncbi:MAG: MFS transporter, partial [Betaproteobacteria bacterium]